MEMFEDVRPTKRQKLMPLSDNSEPTSVEPSCTDDGDAAMGLSRYWRYGTPGKLRWTLRTKVLSQMSHASASAAIRPRSVCDIFWASTAVTDSGNQRVCNCAGQAKLWWVRLIPRERRRRRRGCSWLAKQMQCQMIEIYSKLQNRSLKTANSNWEICFRRWPTLVSRKGWFEGVGKP